MPIILHQPEIAANFGNILRSCACFDTEIGVIEPTGFPLAAKDVRRAAMDYGPSVTLSRYRNWDHFRESARGRRILFTTRGSQPLTSVTLKPTDNLIFGSESAGVPDGIHEQCDLAVRIPIAEETRSLNLANSVAIALFETFRQSARDD